MAAPKTVTLFLMDGSPAGRIKCTLGNWIGQVYRIPRTEITRSADREELKQTGVYFLFGTDADSGDEIAYVGQARERKNGNGVLGRVMEHFRQEKNEYFTHAACWSHRTIRLAPQRFRTSRMLSTAEHSQLAACARSTAMTRHRAL